MGLFSTAFDDGWLAGMAQAADGNRTVTYTRSSTSISVAAVLGQTVTSQNVDGAARIEVGDRDYLILVDDLTLGTPQIGDRITDGSLVFELQDTPTGDPAWRYTGPDRAEFRLHMKRVS